MFPRTLGTAILTQPSYYPDEEIEARGGSPMPGHSACLVWAGWCGQSYTRSAVGCPVTSLGQEPFTLQPPLANIKPYGVEFSAWGLLGKQQVQQWQMSNLFI